MRHADDVLRDAEFSAVFDHRVQCRDQCFGAFDAEALGTDELLAEELLEDHRFVQLLQDLLLLVQREGGRVARAFHALLHPLDLLGIADVLELHTDAGAIGLFQKRHDVAQLARADAHFVAGGEDRIEIGIAELEVHQLQGGRVLAPVAHRIGAGE